MAAWALRIKSFDRGNRGIVDAAILKLRIDLFQATVGRVEDAETTSFFEQDSEVVLCLMPKWEFDQKFPQTPPAPRTITPIFPGNETEPPRQDNPINMIRDDVVCKGSWMLGTACGQCEKCKAEAVALLPEQIAFDKATKHVIKKVAALCTACEDSPSVRLKEVALSEIARIVEEALE